MIGGKATRTEEELEGILRLVGTIKLSCSDIPEQLCDLIRPETANQLCLDTSKERLVKFIRLLGGLFAVSQDISNNDKRAFLNALDKLTFDINVPNQVYALTRLRAWLED